MKETQIKESITCKNGGKSNFHVNGNAAVIIDENICDPSPDGVIFPYTLITDKQNEYMHRYEKVYRILKEDAPSSWEHLTQRDTAEAEFSEKNAARENAAETSPLEPAFEKTFTNVYDMLKMLRESNLKEH